MKTTRTRVARLSRIAVVDDNNDVAQNIAEELRIDKLVPLIQHGPYREIEQLLNSVRRDEAQALVCDHRLNSGSYANFYGAEVVASLYKEGFPCVLMTSYSRSDFDPEIRRYRRFIPSLLGGSEVTATTIQSGLEDCIKEFEGVYRIGRKPLRTIVRIDTIETQGKMEYVYAVVPAWDPSTIVGFPYNLLSNEIKSHLKKGTRLFAEVNIDAREADELFFDKFELGKGT